MALYFECRINKKHTPSHCFLAILPTGECPPYMLDKLNNYNKKTSRENTLGVQKRISNIHRSVRTGGSVFHIFIVQLRMSSQSTKQDH